MTLISDNVTSQSQKQKRIYELKALKNKLKTFGEKEHLNMFLTGAGGTGKSQVIYTSQVFCCQFAAKLGMMFNVFYNSMYRISSIFVERFYNLFLCISQ